MGKKCLINVEGGLGKNVMLTALMPIIAKEYEEIYVISPYVDVFRACSYVADAFEPGSACASLYQELVLDEECTVLWKDPYSNSRFIKKQCHLFEAWLEELDITTDEDLSQLVPVLDNIKGGVPATEKIMADIKDKIGERLIMVQFCGGQSPLTPQVDQNGNPVPYNDHQEYIKRNFYKGQELINKLKEKYPEATIVHYSLPNEPSYDNTIKLEIPYITYPLLADKAFKIVCTDSSLQHLSTGRCADITVIWGETRPEHFGYSCNKNIVAKHVFNSQPYFRPMGTSPSIVKMPSVADILAEVEK